MVVSHRVRGIFMGLCVFASRQDGRDQQEDPGSNQGSGAPHSPLSILHYVLLIVLHGLPTSDLVFLSEL